VKAKTGSTQEERRKTAKKQELENQIAKLEAQLSEISEKLANPPKDAGVVIQLAKDYDLVQKEMDEKLAEWEALQ